MTNKISRSGNNPIKMGLKLGAALGLVVVCIGIIRYKTGMILRGDQRLSYAYWVIFTITVFLAIFRFKRKYPVSFSFKQNIKIGICAGFLSGAIYTIYIVILNNYIDTELSFKIIQFNEQVAISGSEDLSKEDAVQSIKTMSMSSILRGSIYTLVCMTFGLIHSIIATIAAKRIIR